MFSDLKILINSSVVSDQGPSNLRPDIMEMHEGPLKLRPDITERTLERHLTIRGVYALPSVCNSILCSSPRVTLLLLDA